MASSKLGSSPSPSAMEPSKKETTSEGSVRPARARGVVRRVGDEWKYLRAERAQRNS
jgi:hypothetical protein